MVTSPLTVELSRRRFLGIAGGVAVGMVVGARPARAGPKKRNAPAAAATGVGAAFNPTIQASGGGSGLYSNTYSDIY
jgi:hypothetical protein